MNKARYVIITAVKDEEKYIEETLLSMISQTVKPVQWVIVDDGSKDDTSRIIERYTGQNVWIKHVITDKKTARYPGYPVVAAFNIGFNNITVPDYDFIVKLDGDLRFGEDYFEKLIRKFDDCERLGIASGVYLEKKRDRWDAVQMPEYHAAGACKFMRRNCFEQIGGFVPSMGWDTIDEIKAQAHGWETAHFPEIQFYHLKHEGTGIGRLRTGKVHGRIFYLTGGSPFFFILKAVKRMVVGRPPVLNGLFMTWGFLKPFALREKRLVTKEEASLYNRLLAGRVSLNTHSRSLDGRGAGSRRSCRG